MTLRIKKSFFTTTNIILIFLVLNFMTLTIVIGLLNYNIQTRETGQNELITLSKAIHESDNIESNRTEYLLNRTIANQFGTYLQLVNSTNQTNSLIKFLTDNFGAESGYLEKENFQYAQANKTFEMIGQILNRTR